MLTNEKTFCKMKKARLVRKGRFYEKPLEQGIWQETSSEKSENPWSYRLFPKKTRARVLIDLYI